MTLLGPTIVLYLVVGVGVAVAVYLSAARPSLTQLWFQMVTAILFWPMYLPILLAAPRQPSENSQAQLTSVPEDDMSAAIGQVDAELESALSSLDGWAEDVLARERHRIRELRDAWIAQADRVGDMDHVLAFGIHQLTFADKVLNDDSQKRPRLSNNNDSPPVNHRMALSQEACR